MLTRWQRKMYDLAKYLTGWSKDPSHKVAAVIINDHNHVLGIGYNGFPRRIDESITERHTRPAKYLYTEHAERNAIYNVARTLLQGSTITLQWYPCADCARAIIQCGIKTVICEEPDWNDPRWSESFIASKQMFSEADVEVIYADN